MLSILIKNIFVSASSHHQVLAENKILFPDFEELEGIKENGELFYEYYFKEYHSTETLKKISYASETITRICMPRQAALGERKKSFSICFIL